ncbi:hypothetical protein METBISCDRAFT_23682 [Metschnikowia bicuspidata]|uniref:non-specific serine/threonine protein kinase n=1 Tax=Metschnikowia bicuspidata TaxID=27322 RepID=A0A4P9ZD11_9ASCO|nr:hypothetical protein METBISCDRAFT_23682 [Metschnikowia bicuspidata]
MSKLAFLDRFKDRVDEALEADPVFATVGNMPKMTNPNVQFLRGALTSTDASQSLEEQPFISSIRKNIGQVEIGSFRGLEKRGPAGLDDTASSGRGVGDALRTEQHGTQEAGKGQPGRKHGPCVHSEGKENVRPQCSDSADQSVEGSGDVHGQRLLRSGGIRLPIEEHVNYRNREGAEVPHVAPRAEELAEGGLQPILREQPYYRSPNGAVIGRKVRQRPLQKPGTDRANDTRKLSVVVAVTPAQRIEKHPGMGSENALDSLEIYEEIGRGAHGVVYKALNKETELLLAVKVMRCDKDELAGLMGEIDLLKILKHRNIVKYHGFVKTADSVNVMLEFCSGGSLRQLYKRLGHGLAEHEMVPYVKQILEGLQYLHDQGVVHRDVKAANVLLTESGEVKLADFGVATTVTTLHNTVVGTPHWMAPERVLGGDGSCTASDIWSLGATIIELFTMSPPYHDLVPMAAIHAIMNNEHPPLPHALTPAGQNFLLECFQKTASLRKSAALLLLHWWVNPRTAAPTTPRLGELTRLDSAHDQSPREPGRVEHTRPERAKQKYTRAELLSKYREAPDDDVLSLDLLDSLAIRDRLARPAEPKYTDTEADAEYEQFSKFEICSFSSKESEKEREMVHLLGRLSARVAQYSAGGDDVVGSLTRMTARMHLLVRKYPSCVHVLQKDHGMVTFMELLDYSSELPREERLWYLTLGALNSLFAKDVSQMESFATLGGIPKLIQFSKPSNGDKIKLQVVRFLKTTCKSELALRMFLASGGLQIAVRFLQEDFARRPELPLVSVSCIYEILSRDLSCPRSDLCKMLCKHGIVFWFATLLSQLTKTPASGAVLARSISAATDTILKVISYLGAAGAKVQSLIANPDTFKLLLKLYDTLTFAQQMILLKFFKPISSTADVMRLFVSADILELYVSLLREYRVGVPNYKEVLNVLCPAIYQSCLLNYERQTELVKLGAVPYLRDLCHQDLPSRQFILPVFFELVHCDAAVRLNLLKHNAQATYFALVQDPYWSYNAIDSLLHWGLQDKKLRWLSSDDALAALVGVFVRNEVLNLEAFLDIYHQVMLHHRNLVRYMTRGTIVQSILAKLASYAKSAAVSVTLLKILHRLVKYNAHHQVLAPETMCDIFAAMQPIASSDASSVLAASLASRIVLFTRSCS